MCNGAHNIKEPLVTRVLIIQTFIPNWMPSYSKAMMIFMEPPRCSLNCCTHTHNIFCNIVLTSECEALPFNEYIKKGPGKIWACDLSHMGSTFEIAAICLAVIQLGLKIIWSPQWWTQTRPVTWHELTCLVSAGCGSKSADPLKIPWWKECLSQI